jgi:SAM-dependent methyltransferase
MTSGSGATFSLSTAQYVRFTRRFGLRNWLQAGPDYSRAVEYPLVADLLGARAGERLLDVGAGRRAEFASLAAAAGLQVTAIDPRPDAGEDAPAAVRVVAADARELPFEDGYFDRITAISTIEHIEDGDGAAMAELARVLAPGGRFVITVPFNPLKRATVFMRGGVYGREGDRVFFEYLYDEDSLQERLIGPSGLRVVDRVHLAEPGIRLSRAYYDPRSAVWKALRYRLPVGPLLALAAPRYLRPSPPEAYSYEDWTGVAVAVALER